MTINKTLEEIRNRVKAIQHATSCCIAADEALELADFFAELDKHLSEGGHRPKDWAYSWEDKDDADRQDI